MDEALLRTEMLLGPSAMEKLSHSHVAVLGLGGVGSWCAEALARSGVGALTLADCDQISPSNLNRQLVATLETLGRPKAEAMAERVSQLSPNCKVHPLVYRYTPEDRGVFFSSHYDFIVDAIDTVGAKLELIARAYRLGVPVVSAMGCGNRLDATKFIVTDIYQTQNDPLARVMRRELRRRGVPALRVVCSTAPALAQPAYGEAKGTVGRIAPGSVSWVPGVAGLLLAGEAVRLMTADKPLAGDI